MPIDVIDTIFIRAALGLIIGLILGSFTTMLSYRLPRGLSIVSPPSTCPSCKTRLSPRDLIPVLSWLMHRGRCRHCAAPIGARYVLIESATALACVGAFVAVGFSLWLALWLAAIVAVVCALTIRLESVKNH